ncbi:ABC transporter permease [Irregularibacter muris]|uniref:ABC transporter permease n=1 Tax=Irregularibacter muris TaxID=1796619 RepID=A0AAE3HF87_9FIRM|nr:ABC transporter permease [Irregularibacter muris]MCR1897488.1 ABC transporter permease [Irregularibacter muris]
MIKLLRSDLYRFGKSRLFYGGITFTAFLAFFLTMIMRQDIRVGISVFGSITTFKGIEDILRLGIEYQKGLGILIAILISVLIGQEYQWKTWQHKWIINKSRTRIYLSKAILSSIMSVSIFLIFELIALFSSGQISNILTNEYVAMIICGTVLYATLGTFICLFSMLIRKNTTSIVVCLCYVLFSRTLWTIIRNLSNSFSSAAKIIELGIRHSIYGMTTIISTTSVSLDMVMSIVINSAIIMFITTMFGLIIFRKYEL